MTATGRKKIDELYHPPCERSEFYSMSDLNKPPVLFSPAEDIDKVNILITLILCPAQDENGKIVHLGPNKRRYKCYNSMCYSPLSHNIKPF
jgi:hypothetical protein